MQPGADLALLEVAEVVAEGVEPVVLVRKFLTPRGFLQQMLDFVFEFVRPFWIHRFALSVFFEQAFHAVKVFVKPGAGERRCEVVHDHGGGATLGLRALSGVVDDERIQVRQRPQHTLRKILRAERDTASGKPFKIAVLAEMNDGVGGKMLMNPVIEREVIRGRG